MTERSGARPVGRTFDVALVCATAAVAVSSFVILSGIGGESFTNGLSNVLQTLAPALAAATCVTASRRAVGSGWRVGWLLVGMSCATWAVGQLIWTWLESVQGVDPFPSPADAFFLGALPLAIAGILFFPSAPATHRGRTRTLLDGFVVATSVLLISWLAVLGPTLRDSSGTQLERAIGLAYPAADVVVLTIVIIAYVRCDPAGRAATGLVTLGFVAFAVADSTFIYTTMHAEMTSNISNVAWFAGYLLVALGGLRAATTPATRVSALAPSSRTGRAAALLPYLPVAAVLVIAMVAAATADPIVVDHTLFWIGAALIFLLLVRQGLAVLENARLARWLEQSNRRLQYRVLHDELTDLPNRPLFTDRLRVALARMKRVDEVLAVMFVDLDGFKPINDTYGHQAGDQVLATVSQRLAATLRSGDTVARFAGDEFLVLCEDVGGAEASADLARRLLGAVAEPQLVEDQELTVTASIGLVVVDTSEADADELVRRADAAMYEAKRRGGANLRLVDARTRPRLPYAVG